MTTEINTERLLLRELKASDAGQIFSLRSNKDVNRFLDRTPATELKDADVFIQKIQKEVASGNSFYWAVTVKPDPKLIGTLCLWNLSADRKRIEIGYELVPEMQGKGIMREAVEAIINFSRNELKLDQLDAYSHKQNEASTQLLRNLNFILNDSKADPDNANHLAYELKL
ncbi:MAG TPA: GNAT family N-acetyltransferase [Chthoniobacterales bacterium]|nr:GNAT family N-acetyltransferase [Chthoniobacterales bacterium]